jgi:hypothetical protein
MGKSKPRSEWKEMTFQAAGIEFQDFGLHSKVETETWNVNLKSFEIALVHLNKQQDEFLEATSLTVNSRTTTTTQSHGANPKHVPSGKKERSGQQESNSRTSDHDPEKKQKCGTLQPLLQGGWRQAFLNVEEP